MSKLRSEINLILRNIQRGDKAQEKVLYDFTFNYLKVIARKYASNKNDCEDILAESYLRIFKYINTADASKDGYNWLCKIVQNVAYDFNKKCEPTISLESASFSKDTEIAEDCIYDKDELLTEIRKLPVYEQKLIYMRFYEDRTYSQIAKSLNSKKSTVHKQVLNIIKKIREKF